MKIFKYIIYYSFVIVYQTAILIQATPKIFKGLFALSSSSNAITAKPKSSQLRVTLLRTAFRSIL